MKRTILALALILTLMVFLSCSDDNKTAGKIDENVVKTVKVGTSGGYYPFTFVKDDVLQGFEIDVWNAIAKELGYEVEFVQAKFSGLFGMLETDKIDTISNQISITEKRKEKYNFSDPYVYSGAQVVINADNDEVQSINDLSGKSVGVDLGSNYEELIRAHNKNDDITVKAYEAGASFVQDVIFGRLDAFVMDRESIAVLIKDKKLNLKFAGSPIDFNENAFPFVKGKGDNLRAEVNIALNNIRNSGKLAEISDKWFDINITSKE